MSMMLEHFNPLVRKMESKISSLEVEANCADDLQEQRAKWGAVLKRTMGGMELLTQMFMHHENYAREHFSGPRLEKELALLEECKSDFLQILEEMQGEV